MLLITHIHTQFDYIEFQYKVNGLGLITSLHQVNIFNFPAADWTTIQRERLTGTTPTGIAVVDGLLHQCDPILDTGLPGAVTALHEIFIQSYNVLEFSAKGTLRHVFHNITSLVAGCWESTPLSQQLLVSTYVPTE